MRRFSTLLTLVLAGAALAPTADAQLLSSSGGPTVSTGNPLDARLGGSNLVLDDSTAEDGVGLQSGAQFLWFNRFTPPAADFPLTLESAEVLFTATDRFPLGATYDVFVYSDPDGDPANGADYVGGQTGQTVTALDVFLSTAFPSALSIPTVGDVLIMVVNRSNNTAGIFPAAIDETDSQARSWVGIFPAGATPGSPPVLPVTGGTYNVIDNLGGGSLEGNWMIRGTYTVPVAGENGADAARASLTASPNPVRGASRVRLAVAEGQDVTVAVYDALGRRVATLFDGALAADQALDLALDASGLPAGVYVVRATGATVALTQCVTVVR